MMSTLQEDLDRLGRLDPGTIARTFRRMGIKGTPGFSGSCPVANYLRLRGHVAPRAGSWVTTTTSGEVYTPDNVGTFIDRFDSGHYQWISTYQ